MRDYGLRIGYAARKSTDQSWTSSTTLAQISELTVPVEANRSYLIRWHLFVSGDAAGDIQLQLDVPAGSSATGGALGGMGQGTTSLVNADQHGLLTPGTSVVYGTAGQNQPNMIVVSAIVRTGSTAGVAGLLAAQNAANAVPTVVRADSWVEAWVLL